MSVAVLIINIHKYKSRAVTLYLIKHRILIRADFIDISHCTWCMIDYLIGQWAFELLISFWRICHRVFVLHFVTRDIFGLKCRRSRLEHVIMWHFELSSFSIENRFLITVHFWEDCNFCRGLVFGFEVRMFWQVYRFWSPLLLESYWFRIKSITGSRNALWVSGLISDSVHFSTKKTTHFMN